MRTVEWDYTNNKLKLIDQRLLPDVFEVVTFDDHREVASAIRDMVVRGAPAIGATAAFGLALSAYRSDAETPSAETPAAETPTVMLRSLRDAAEILHQARPTAANLDWALQRVLKAAEKAAESRDSLRQAVLEEAQRIADEDIAVNLQMAEYGSGLIEDGDTLLHHCNTGALATVDWGTALGVIRMAHERGKRIHVLVDETRPRLQGSRLTAWELEQYGIPYEIISDNAAGFFLSKHRAQKVFFGADRVAANGDVANKIGTYMLALAAHDNHIPVYCVAPTSTIDLTLERGQLIPIEERSEDEVLNLRVGNQRVSPQTARASNPAFDITPHRLLTAIITEKGIIYPPFHTNLRRIVQPG